MKPLTEAYRPRDINQVVGNDSLKATVRAWLVTGRYPAAIMLHGPRGAAKTTVARIMARVRCCLGPQGGVACGTCKSCVLFEENRDKHSGYMEIDAGKDRGIQAMRELVQIARQKPRDGVFKTIVIDEAQGITPDGQDSLLKFLEEPPDHVLVILCTTDPEKIKSTVIDRCTKFQMRSLSVEECSGLLMRICEQEGLEGITEAQVDAITRATKCAPRPALHVLDRVYTLVLAAKMQGEEAGIDAALEDIIRDVVNHDVDTQGAAIARAILSGLPGQALHRANQVRYMAAEVYQKVLVSMRAALQRALAKKYADSAYEDVWVTKDKNGNTTGVLPVFKFIDDYDRAKAEKTPDVLAHEEKARLAKQAVLDAHACFTRITDQRGTSVSMADLLDGAVCAAGMAIQTAVSRARALALPAAQAAPPPKAPKAEAPSEPEKVAAPVVEAPEAPPRKPPVAKVADFSEALNGEGPKVQGQMGF